MVLEKGFQKFGNLSNTLCMKRIIYEVLLFVNVFVLFLFLGGGASINVNCSCHLYLLKKRRLTVHFMAALHIQTCIKHCRPILGRASFYESRGGFHKE